MKILQGVPFEKLQCGILKIVLPQEILREINLSKLRVYKIAILKIVESLNHRITNF